MDEEVKKVQLEGLAEIRPVVRSVLAFIANMVQPANGIGAAYEKADDFLKTLESDIKSS